MFYISPSKLPSSCIVASLNTIKVDIFGVQDITRVDTESDTLNFGGTLLGSRFVFDPNLGFTSVEHRVVNVTFGVLSLPG